MTYDNVNPDHYKGDRKFEPIEVIEDWGLNYRLGCALKYISRNGRKPGEDPAEGLRKAVWYLQREISAIEKPSYDSIVDQMADEMAKGDPDFPAGLDDVIFYQPSEPELKLEFSKSGNVFLARDDDWEDFWSEEDADVLWDPSLGPAELTDAEIYSIISRKDLSQFDDNEIVSTVEKRGFILGVKKDGSTCILKDGGICE